MNEVLHSLHPSAKFFFVGFRMGLFLMGDKGHLFDSCQTMLTFVDTVNQFGTMTDSLTEIFDYEILGIVDKFSKLEM